MTLASVQTAADGTVPGSLILAAVLCLAGLAIFFAVRALIRANRVINNAPQPTRAELTEKARHALTFQRLRAYGFTDEQAAALAATPDLTWVRNP